MERQAVSSSNLVTIGYDVTKQILEIEFNNGDVYRYFDVPDYEYERLMGASSHGKYFSAHIKNEYEYKKI